MHIYFQVFFVHWHSAILCVYLLLCFSFITIKMMYFSHKKTDKQHQHDIGIKYWPSTKLLSEYWHRPLKKSVNHYQAVSSPALIRISNSGRWGVWALCVCVFISLGKLEGKTQVFVWQSVLKVRGWFVLMDKLKGLLKGERWVPVLVCVCVCVPAPSSISLFCLISAPSSLPLFCSLCHEMVFR